MTKNEFIFLLAFYSVAVFVFFMYFSVKVGCPLTAGWIALTLGISVITGAAMVHNEERRSR